MSQNLEHGSAPLRIAEASAAQRAAYMPHSSVWVSANAGTGKTRVLTQRILALLLADPTLAPRQILALTFTRAAAGEMATRLPKMVQEWAAKPALELAHEIPQSLGLTYTASMPARLLELAEQVRHQPPTLTTIHGFAQQVLAALPAVAGLPEGFALLDDGGQKRLLKQVQDTLLLNPPEVLAGQLATLLDNLGETALHDLPQLLVGNWWRVEEILGPHGLAEGVGKVLARLDAALALPPREEAYRVHLPTPTQCAAMRQMGIAVPESEDAWAKILLTTAEKTARKAPFKKDLQQKISPEVYATFIAAAAELEAALKARSAWRGREMTEALLVWAAQVQVAYRSAKQQRGVVDFNDLLQALEYVLASPAAQTDNDAAAWLWHRLDIRYRHLVIDEAQDNNASQSRIITALAQNLLAGDVGDGARTVLAVGDVKQSIYRFQGAQPQWFIALREVLETWAPNMRTLQLAYTFRNNPIILDVVNAAFAAPEMASALQGEPMPWPHHISVHEARPARVELWPLVQPMPGDAASEESDEGPDTPETEAAVPEIPSRWLLAEERAAQVKPSAKVRSLQQVATWLKAQHAAGVVLPSTGQPLAWHDILVVVQRNETAQLLGALLKREGIPVAAGVGQLPLAVQDVVALLRVAYNPADTLALAQVLKGLCGWSDAELLALSQTAQGGPWFAALPETGEGLTPRRHLKAFLADRPEPCPPAALVQWAVAWWGLALPDFTTLLAWAEAAEAAPFPHLGALGSLVSRLETEDLPPSTLVQGQSWAGGVQILTVHRAKGLEAPLVILPETTRKLTESQDKLLWGDGLMMYKTKKGISVLEDDLRDTEATQCRADGLRGLYVGLTRAIDWLVIGGWQGGKQGGVHEKTPPEA